MREGEGNNLTGVGGISHNFLITRHRGVEAKLGYSDACGAKALAVKNRSIAKR
jgi:hypothetical protein